MARGWTAAASRWTESDTARANARRRRMFVATLVAALAATLAFTWLRPPEYRASARVEITPALEAPPSLPTATAGASVVVAPAPANDSARPFLTQVQMLTSRPVIERALAALERNGEKPAPSTVDPVGWIQAHIDAAPVSGTNVVELAAVGPQPSAVANLVNAMVDAYREQLAESYRDASSQAIAQLDDEIARLEATVTAKRRDVEAFRIRNNIVSLERGENEALAQVRNLSQSLNNANERVATADGKLRALRGSVAEGRSPGSEKDDPVLANLEQRAAQVRDDLAGMERSYTPQYLEREPKAIALRARLADLERKIAAQRETGHVQALAKAEEDLAAAQGALSRLQSQIASGRQEASQFASRFNEYKLQQESLDDLENAYRDALQRRTRLEASARARMPALGVVEPATVPQEPWRPLYYRDSAIALAASLMLALLAMWLVELFNRAEPQPSVVVVQPQPSGVAYAGAAGQLAPPPTPALPPGSAPMPALPGTQPRLPRELRNEEVSALLAAGDAETRTIVLLLLGGIGVDEIGALRRRDADAVAGRVRIPGRSPREIAVGDALGACLAAGASARAPESALVGPPEGLSRESIDLRILCAAHDAGLDDPAEVTAECLRHTYVAFLVRSRLRFADLPRIVGDLPAEALRSYSALAPVGARHGLETVDTVHPAVRDLAAGRP